MVADASCDWTRCERSRTQKLGFVASPEAAAEAARDALHARYDGVSPEDADVIVALAATG